MILIENGVIEQGKTLLPYVSQFYHTDLSVQDRTTPSNKSHVTTNFQTYEMFCTDWTNMSKGGSFSQQQTLYSPDLTQFFRILTTTARTVKDLNIFQLTSFFLRSIKLDGVGPNDIRPSTNQHHHFVPKKKKKIRKKRKKWGHVIPDTGHLTHDT